MKRQAERPEHGERGVPGKIRRRRGMKVLCASMPSHLYLPEVRDMRPGKQPGLPGEFLPFIKLSRSSTLGSGFKKKRKKEKVKKEERREGKREGGRKENFSKTITILII